MDDIERLRSESEAHTGMAEKSGRTWRHEDLLVRYLGALTYQPRREATHRDRPEAGGADVRAGDDGVRRRSRRPWWRRAR
jgi:hypothetical protein